MIEAAVRGPNCRGGTIVSSLGNACTVEFPRQRCDGCSGHCAMSVFGTVPMRLTMRALDGNPVPKTGARVWVAVAERAILRAAIGVFGMPLLGMVAASAVASALGISESAAGWIAVSGLLAGFAAGAIALRRGAPTRARLHDGYAERAVTLFAESLFAGTPLNQAASVRSEARSDLFNMGKSRIT
jgi:positive regulator of sigma E activity